MYKRSINRIKRNPIVFNSLLSKTRKINNNTDGLGITFNKNNSKYKVIKVCNPYCGPCAKAHPILEELVQKGQINLQMLFTAKNDGKDLKAKPVKHFLAIAGRNDPKRTQKALDDWYNAPIKDYEAFSQKYPLNGELEQQGEKIEAMRQWCDIQKITHTPTLFINGHELPREYSLEDLKEVLI